MDRRSIMDAEHRRMEKLTKGLPSKSEKMRTLAGAGYARADIARFLGTRYQFVRNVLAHDEQRKARRDAASESSSPGRMGPTKIKLGPDGRIVIPAAFREA